ncbi:HNH endonuclease [Phenylobacterium kunshanense]|uniref:HNH endonuclease n=1 Tax=Phenylobacterium kunshanense TaxID=1445034 RepID=A0A328BRZ6_9CAUL|nr:HNH endonuclease [Phenylobacterium kunshanense]RAK68776.1 HNH endonuclease [Phenylobacterium kunshanense]
MLVEPTALDRRSVPEWIGATPDTPVPARVKLRVFERYQGRCYLSGRKIGPGETWEVEHVRAIGLGGENRESNLAPALADAHKVKTRDDRAAMSKANRIRAKHLGIHPKSKARIRSRGFAPTR